MIDECYIVLDREGRRLAGPFTEKAARLWVAFHFHSPLRPYAIACVGPTWTPLVRYETQDAVPREVWALQRGAEVIVVKTPEGKFAVFS